MSVAARRGRHISVSTLTTSNSFTAHIMGSSNPIKPSFWADLIYDAWLWTFSVLVDLFFREVHPRSGWKVPKEGPVIFVCAPHANQVWHLFPAFARSTPEANEGSSSTL